jgi:exodeoxyribonuclease VII small subunit
MQHVFAALSPAVRCFERRRRAAPAIRDAAQAPPEALRTMAQSSESPASFEAALAELEQIVATMEGGALPLKDSLAAYKRGAVLLQYCQAALKDAEQQVEVLEKGVLRAFDAAGGSAAADDEP